MHQLSQPEWTDPPEKSITVIIRNGRFMSEHTRAKVVFQFDPEDPELLQLRLEFWDTVLLEEYGSFVLRENVDPRKVVNTNEYALPFAELWKRRRYERDLEDMTESYLNEMLYRQHHVDVYLHCGVDVDCIGMIHDHSLQETTFFTTIPREEALRFVVFDDK